MFFFLNCSKNDQKVILKKCFSKTDLTFILEEVLFRNSKFLEKYLLILTFLSLQKYSSKTFWFLEPFLLKLRVWSLAILVLETPSFGPWKSITLKIHTRL